MSAILLRLQYVECGGWRCLDNAISLGQHRYQNWKPCRYWWLCAFYNVLCGHRRPIPSHIYIHAWVRSNQTVSSTITDSFNRKSSRLAPIAVSFVPAFIKMLAGSALDVPSISGKPAYGLIPLWRCGFIKWSFLTLTLLTIRELRILVLVAKIAGFYSIFIGAITFHRNICVWLVYCILYVQTLYVHTYYIYIYIYIYIYAESYKDTCSKSPVHMHFYFSHQFTYKWKFRSNSTSPVHIDILWFHRSMSPVIQCSRVPDPIRRQVIYYWGCKHINMYWYNISLQCLFVPA